MKKNKDFKKKEVAGKEPSKQNNGSNSFDKKYATKLKDFRSCNDISWYNQNPQALRDASSIQYANVLGLDFTMHYDMAGTTYSQPQNVPGILAIRYMPTIGASKDANSNVNVAARLAYAFMRHANSGSRNYYDPDYMIYLLAVSNAQAFYAWMVRLYGLLNYTSVMNRYVNKGLVTSAGGDYESLVKNMSSFRYYINYFGNKLNSFATPKDQYLFDRYTFLPLHVFADGDSPRSQLYIFNPEGFYMWDATTFDTGSALVFKELTDSMSYESIVAFGDDILNALLENEDIGMMSGDTLKAYGSDGIRQVGTIDEKYITPILKDDGMLAQIHNANAVGKPTYTDCTITQSENNIINNWKIRHTTNYFIPNDKLLDTWINEPSPEFTMEATRLVTFLKHDASQDEGESKIYVIDTCGTEIITRFTMYYYFGSSLEFTDFGACISESYGGPQYEKICNLDKFDWAPIVPVVTFAGGIASTVKYFGDLQNYTVLTNVECGRIHNVALLSLLNVYGLYIRTR